MSTIAVTPVKLPAKMPEEVLDYTLDFTKWLDAGDTISTATASLGAGDAAIGTVTKTNTTATFWLSGGTSGHAIEVLVKAVTAGGRTYVAPCTMTIGS